MASVTEEVADIEQQQGWNTLFQDIKRISSQYNFSCQVARQQENRNKNRYRDVCPFDHSRVKLREGPSDYINGCLVEVEDAERRYILSQGPLPHTAGQFWQMVWEHNSKAVIMLNRIIEKGMVKCHHYWPKDDQHPLHFRDEGFGLTLKSETKTENFDIRELELVNMKNNESRIIFQFHFTAWPDFDVPQSPAAFLDFLACIRENRVLENDFGPAVIHCSAGIGRSGTFILVDTCLEYLQKGLSFKIYKTLLEMRKYRMGLVQTPQQLRFSYFAIAECERIILYKQSDEDSFSEGTPSEDYDFIYDGDDEFTTNETSLSITTDEQNGSEPTANLNRRSSEDKSLIEKTQLNNNVNEPIKIEPPSLEIKTDEKEFESESTQIESNPVQDTQMNGVEEQSDEIEKANTVPIEDQAEEIINSTDSNDEAENIPKTSDGETEIEQKQELIEMNDEISCHTPTDKESNLEHEQIGTDILNVSSISGTIVENEPKEEKSKSLSSQEANSRVSDELPTDNLEITTNKENTVKSNEPDEKAFETIQKPEEEERTWIGYLVGGLVLSFVFSLMYYAYE